MSPVEISDYDPAWPLVFEGLRARIWPAVSDIALSVEHVGSTAVPGLAAKPIVDMDVVVAPGQVATGIERLATLGYGHRGDLGVPGREAFRAPAGLPRHHLYLCPADSEALANHLAVRDALRSSPSMARAYGALKRRLADELADDGDGYGAGKTDFLLELLAAAGFSERALDDIRRINAG